ncbi:hypothetical protein GF366_02880 [Candidatus Peregrinibacteria bacterium]|nr:hypothetical protein [Candidatus Peregrinibacteria bacterium]
MGVRTKVLVSVLLVGAVIGILVIQTENRQLFKGQIFEEPEEEVEIVSREALPDLKPDLEILPPENGENDIIADVTIENIGEGAIVGGQPFNYAIYIGGEEVFTNSDSYSALEPGDAFSFNYPIPRTIYGYENSGTISVILDTEDTIKESNEENNEIEKQYNF